MPVSPQDFSLWARVTGNKYPSTVKEKAKLAPDVHRFIQNLDKEGMLEGKKPKKEESLGSKVAKGALVAGAVWGGLGKCLHLILSGDKDTIKLNKEEPVGE